MSGIETKYHTIAHLTLRCLQEIYGQEIECKGCNMSDERLRFDFNLDRKMTEEEKNILVDKINKYIDEGLKVEKKEMSLEEARKIGAHGIFDNKYEDNVYVYTIGDISNEICGGPHVENTSELSHIKLTKEESSSKGVRRIKLIMI